jgi:hypothetical protein
MGNEKNGKIVMEKVDQDVARFFSGLFDTFVENFTDFNLSVYSKSSKVLTKLYIFLEETQIFTLQFHKEHLIIS